MKCIVQFVAEPERTFDSWVFLDKTLGFYMCSEDTPGFSDARHCEDKLG